MRENGMIQFIPMLVMSALFVGIGMYWAFAPEHFLDWTTRSDLTFRKRIDQIISNPNLVEKSYANFSRMQANGTIETFLWSVRFLGIILAFFSIFASSYMVSSFIHI
jgi:hypothetical protein